MGITFLTLRRRSPAILREVANTPRSLWRTVHLDVPHRMYQTPKVIDQQVSLRDYEGPIRQMLITVVQSVQLGVGGSLESKTNSGGSSP